MKPPKKKTEETRVVREMIGRFVEDADADSVVVLWTSTGKAGSKAKIASWGNQFAIRDMIKTASDDYTIARISAIKADQTKNPKDAA